MLAASSAPSSVRHFVLVWFVVLLWTKDNNNLFVQTSPVSRQMERELPRPLPEDTPTDKQEQVPHPVHRGPRPLRQTPTQTVEDDAQDSSFSFFGYCGNYLKTEWEKLYGQISTTLKKDKTSDQSGGSRSRRASSHLSSSNQMLPFYQKLVAYPHLTEKFNKTNISWGVLDKSLHRSEKEIDLIITAAFQIWSEVTPLTFHKDHKHPDIIIRFGTGLHGDCPVPFDDLGSQLGHSWTVGEVHINDALSKLHPNILPHVIVHELGHALGLPHDEKDPTAIMYSVYYTPTRGSPAKAQSRKIKLSQSDVDAIQDLYGRCTLRTTSISALRVNLSYPLSYVVNDGHVYTVSTLKNKTLHSQSKKVSLQHEDPSVTPKGHSQVKGHNNNVLTLLQLGKSHEHASYIVTKDLHVFEVDAAGNSLRIKTETGQHVTEMWPCFGEIDPPSENNNINNNDNNINLDITSIYYNRRDRNIYFYTGQSNDYMIYRYNSRLHKCLDPISFYQHHFPRPFPSSSSESTGLGSNPTDDASSDYADNDPKWDSDYIVSQDNTTPYTFSATPSFYNRFFVKPQDVKLVFQEHDTQETYLFTPPDFWRVRKSDYSLEYGGKIYKEWPYLCTF